MHTKLEQKFHAAMAALPELDEPLNSQVKEYCEGLGNFVRGSNEWYFESGRYFGSRGLEIKEKGWMSLMPKHIAFQECKLWNGQDHVSTYYSTTSMRASKGSNFRGSVMM